MSAILPAGPGLTAAACEVARQVFVRGPVSRAEVARRTGLSAPSVARLASGLISIGLVGEISEGGGRVGRPVRPLAVQPDAGRFLGVQLTAQTASAVLTDLQARVADQAARHIADRRPEAVARLVADLARDFGLGPGPGRPALQGIGVCLGGNASDGRTVTRAPYLGWRGVDLAGLVEARAGLPTVVGNDVVALTKAHHWFGLARGLSDFAVITTGVGVGYGLVTRDQAVDTPDTGLGLGGHIPLDDSGPACPIGLPHRGCAVAMISTIGMLGQAQARLGRPVGYDELLTLAASGDEPAATAIVAAAARALGRLIAVTANLTMHPTIVLGGEGMGLWDIAEETIRQTARQGRDPDASPLRIEVDSTRSLSWSRGAAAMAIQHALTR
ncbi:MAG: ROK family protein [Bifidobacteriaceae bacterium]|jgi:predicted NBD/HSP70 family sugar kinase|nr:ROK family protein [Bifidobacteriaceae bacterium]